MVLAAVRLVAAKRAAKPVEDRKAAEEVAVKAQVLQVADQAQQDSLPVVVEATHFLHLQSNTREASFTHSSFIAAVGNLRFF